MPATPELLRALGVLCEPPEPTHARIAEALCLPGRIDAADHTELFGFQLVPYASVYLGAEGMLGGEAADRVAGFWRALRLTPPPEPDHLAALLGLYATIGEAERGERDRARQALWRQARRALLWEHLLTWAVTYARAVIGSAPPFHAAWAQLLERTLLAEAAGLGLRMGERAFALRSMLSQDAGATLAWLADEAAGWAARHRRTEAVLGEIGRHWRERAEATRALLLELERATEEVTAHAAGC